MSRNVFFTLIVLLVGTFLFSSPAFAKGNKGSKSFGISKAKAPKAQMILSKKVKKELSKGVGKKGIARIKKAKTQKDLVRALNAELKKCEQCPTTKKLLAGLKVGSKGNDTGAVAYFWGDTTDEDGCGWAHCLSHWGSHIPCQGMPGDEEEDPEPKDDDPKEDPPETETPEGN